LTVCYERNNVHCEPRSGAAIQKSQSKFSSATSTGSVTETTGSVTINSRVILREVAGSIKPHGFCDFAPRNAETKAAVID